MCALPRTERSVDDNALCREDPLIAGDIEARAMRFVHSHAALCDARQRTRELWTLLRA